MPRFRDLLHYCQRMGWEQYKEKGDHYYFRKIFPDGTILRTKVSRALSKEIDPRLFEEILKHQLGISREEFNRNS